MSARITVDLAAVHPVFGGVWHRAYFTHFPRPGEPVTTLCGETEPAEFVEGAREPATQPCWTCEQEHRRRRTGPVHTDYPAPADDGVQPQPRPRPYPR